MSFTSWQRFSKNKLEKTLKKAIEELKECESGEGVYFSCYYIRRFNDDIKYRQHNYTGCHLNGKSMYEYLNEYKEVLRKKTGKCIEEILQVELTEIETIKVLVED